MTPRRCLAGPLLPLPGESRLGPGEAKGVAPGFFPLGRFCLGAAIRQGTLSPDTPNQRPAGLWKPYNGGAGRVGAFFLGAVGRHFYEGVSIFAAAAQPAKNLRMG